MRPKPAPSDTNCRRSRPTRCRKELSCPRAPTGHARKSMRNAQLVDRANGRSGIVRAEDRPIILAGPRPSDRTPLTHPDAMTVASSPQYHSRERAVETDRGFDTERRAVENLTTRRAQNISDVVPP